MKLLHHKKKGLQLTFIKRRVIYVSVGEGHFVCTHLKLPCNHPLSTKDPWILFFKTIMIRHDPGYIIQIKKYFKRILKEKH